MRTYTAISLILLGIFLCMPFVAYAAPGPSPLSYLADPEKDYYIKVFNYSMETVQPDQHYDWKSYSGNGSITVKKAFVSPSGTNCRNFSETFVVQGQKGMDKGVGCKRKGQDGWCKLDPTKEAKTCSFEDTNRFFGGVNLSAPTIGTPSLGGGGSVGSAPSANVNVNANVNTSVNTNIDKKDLTAKSYSDAVTGSAGKSAGQAASGFVTWFTQTFLR